ncbi:unnamed protein product, partial [Polarella glacialis]
SFPAANAAAVSATHGSAVLSSTGRPVFFRSSTFAAPRSMGMPVVHQAAVVSSSRQVSMVPVSGAAMKPPSPLSSGGPACASMPPMGTPQQRQAAQHEVGRLLFGNALCLEEDKPQKQLRLIVGGLMGSGKSTVCRMLRHLLGGVWVNQDEFAHLKKGAKTAFLAEIQRACGDANVSVVLVDKINTQKQHRREILDAMSKGGGRDAVFVQIRHPL